MRNKGKLLTTAAVCFALGVFLTIVVLRSVVQDGLDRCEEKLPRNQNCQAELIFKLKENRGE